MLKAMGMIGAGALALVTTGGFAVTASAMPAPGGVAHDAGAVPLQADAGEADAHVWQVFTVPKPSASAKNAKTLSGNDTTKYTQLGANNKTHKQSLLQGSTSSSSLYPQSTPLDLKGAAQQRLNSRHGG